MNSAMTQRDVKSAFTLVELMISIALVVILMLGITKVFTLTAQTAGATNQLSASLRDSRAAHAEMYQDFSAAVRDGSPFMVIHSGTQTAWRNKTDADTDRDGNMLTIDIDGDNQEGDSAGENIPITSYNYRNHRLDMISFFARRRFDRQTGGGGTLGLLSQMSSNEALVWYGHLWLPDNSVKWTSPQGNFGASGVIPNAPAQSPTYPGQGSAASNPNNYYATQWTLGRVVTLLATPNPTSLDIKDLYGTQQRFFVTDPSAATKKITDPQRVYPMSPLQGGAYDSLTNTGAGTTTVFETSRYDLAGTSIDAFRNRLFTDINTSNAYPWFRYVMGFDDIIAVNPQGTAVTGGRFQASPFLTSPVTAQQVAMQAPIFLPACTQFIVEYAGDYFSQEQEYLPNSTTHDPDYGQIIDSYETGPTDGQIDFIVDPVTYKRQIRWYGLPRDTNGVDSKTGQLTGIPDGSVLGWSGTASTLKPSDMVDVVPLRDVYEAAAHSTKASSALQTKVGSLSANQAGAPFEHVLPFPNGNYITSTSTTANPFAYDCAWNPMEPKPKMIRIIFTLDDPNGKLPEGQTFEYVFTLP
jgi:prepilin-type N-terminal cleavage/methylation domain-containing protein